ncbi:hypothetical protein Btru_061175 [Bulinus truncatus]|nr:hypothetical protein Btru_061175 [Bulinus truncatus]
MNGPASYVSRTTISSDCNTREGQVRYHHHHRRASCYRAIYNYRARKCGEGGGDKLAHKAGYDARQVAEIIRLEFQTGALLISRNPLQSNVKNALAALTRWGPPVAKSLMGPPKEMKYVSPVMGSHATDWTVDAMAQTDTSVIPDANEYDNVISPIVQSVDMLQLQDFGHYYLEQKAKTTTLGRMDTFETIFQCSDLLMPSSQPSGHNNHGCNIGIICMADTTRPINRQPVVGVDILYSRQPVIGVDILYSRQPVIGVDILYSRQPVIGVDILYSRQPVIGVDILYSRQPVMGVDILYSRQPVIGVDILYSKQPVMGVDILYSRQPVMGVDILYPRHPAMDADILYVMGNFFIMDSEQLVSKPFRELQMEAANEAQKKSSMTEKLTTVKNNICENHYVMTKEQLERQKMSRLKQLHDNSNKLRQEVKLFNLDRQRHLVEVKKRLRPEKDYSYDETQVLNMERRLGANIASGYLDKKLKYPIRLRSINDIKATPVIQKARECLQQHVMQRTIDTTLRASPRRSQTARSEATPVPSAVYQRRNSRSAPFTSRPSDQNTTSLPTIFHQGGLTSRQEQPPQTARVKFSFHQTDPSLTARTNTFLSDKSLHETKQESESSSEDDPDDDRDVPDYIDLQALFHGNVMSSNSGKNGQSLVSAGHATSIQTPGSIRRRPGSPARLTTDMLQVEMDQINSKINTFIKTLSEPRRVQASSDDDDDFYVGNTAQSFSKLAGNTFRNKPVSYPINRLAKPIGVSINTDPQVTPSTANHPPMPPLPSELTDVSHTAEVTGVPKTPRTPKYSWKYIRGRFQGRGKGEQSTEELVLQALTGVPISNSMYSHVPLRTASRALRHTATFKMHKVVEKLIQERTRYERLQVEELKKQLVAEENTAGQVPGGQEEGGDVANTDMSVTE